MRLRLLVGSQGIRDAHAPRYFKIPRRATHLLRRVGKAAAIDVIQALLDLLRTPGQRVDAGYVEQGDASNRTCCQGDAAPRTTILRPTRSERCEAAG